MFQDSVNGAFNNEPFSPPTISTMHESAVRLYEAAKALADTEGQSAVAALLNESPQTLNNWESRGVSKQGAMKAQAAWGCDANWIRTGDGQMRMHHPAPAPRPIAPAPAQRGDNVDLAQYDTGGAMGGGLVLRDQPGVIRSFNVTREWLEKNLPYFTSIANLAIVTGFGDSMQGLFSPGDPVIVDRGINKADVDGVYFFRVGDEGFIKRLQRIPGQGLLVLSENPKYRDWTITPDMDFQIMAKVLRAWNGQNL